jgi:hypothetical protein
MFIDLSQRLQIAVSHFVEYGTVPTPEEMAKLEPVLPFKKRFVSLTIGDRFGDTFFSATEFKLAQVATKFAPGSKNYLLAYKPDDFKRPTSLGVMCVLHEHAETTDVLRVHFHGMVVGHIFETANTGGERSGNLGVLFTHARELLGEKPHSGRGWGQVMKSSAGERVSHWHPTINLHFTFSVTSYLPHELMMRITDWPNVFLRTVGGLADRLLREQLQQLHQSLRGGWVADGSCSAFSRTVPL